MLRSSTSPDQVGYSRKKSKKSLGNSRDPFEIPQVRAISCESYL